MPKQLPNPPANAEEMTGDELADWFLNGGPQRAALEAHQVTCKECQATVPERASLSGYCIACYDRHVLHLPGTGSPPEAATGPLEAPQVSSNLALAPASPTGELGALQPRTAAAAETLGRMPIINDPAISEAMAALDDDEPDPDLRAELRTQVRRIANLREELAEAEARLRSSKQEWDNDHADDLNAAALLKAQLAAETKAARVGAETLFYVDGDKSPAPGVTIKEFRVLHYADNAALDWCEEHSQFVVRSFDRAKFEDYAKRFSLDFVEVETEPRAQLSSDLSKALEEM